MQIGKPKEVVRVNEPAVPYEGDEKRERAPKRKKEKKEPAKTGA
jgi:hypothetical protein